MARFDYHPAPIIHPAVLADVILAAPAWAHVGITAPTARMREQAATELAAAIARHLTSDARPDDAGQLVFPL